MTYYKVPMAIDAIRLTGRTLSETVSNIVAYLQAGAGGWNHERAAKFLRYAFDGATDRDGLIAACKGDGRDAFLDNAKIVESCLPAIIGRKAQSFRFPRTKFSLTPSLQSSVGPAFFIVEGGVVRLIYIHARNNSRASLVDLAALASLAKSEILDNDFYGLPGDLELHYVDKASGKRLDQVYDLSGLAGLEREPVAATLSRFAEAFIIVDTNRLAGSVKPKRTRVIEADPDQPGFGF